MSSRPDQEFQRVRGLRPQGGRRNPQTDPGYSVRELREEHAANPQAQRVQELVSTPSNPVCDLIPVCGPILKRKLEAANPKRAQMDAANRQAARLILADPDHYGGDEALSVRWARALFLRQETEPKQRRLDPK